MQVSVPAVHVYDPPTPSTAPRVVQWEKVMAVLVMVFVVAMFAYAIFRL
jgi:hypothetical protein